MPLTGHNVPYLIRIVVAVKRNQMLPCHKVADRHALVNKACRRIGIIGGGNHCTTSVLGYLLNGHGNACAFAYHNAVCSHLNSAKL